MGQMDLREKEPSIAILQATQEGTSAPKVQGCCFIRDRDRVAKGRSRMDFPRPHLHREAPTLTAPAPQSCYTKWPETVLMVSWCHSNRNDPEGRSHTGKGTHP